MKKGIIFVISAPSGAGKNTVINEFLKRRKDFRVSVSATTREPRKGEVNGKHYFFYEKSEFLSLVKKGSFLEHAKVLDNYYGTLRRTVADNVKKGKNVIMDVDVQGAAQIKRKLGAGCVTVFIMPPDVKTLEKRLKGRKTETRAAIAKRLALGKKEMKEKSKYDYVIINDKIGDAVRMLEKVVGLEKSLR